MRSLFLLFALASLSTLSQGVDPTKTPSITSKSLRLGGAITCTPGSNCDVSSLSVVPSPSATSGTVARSLADRTSLDSPVFTATVPAPKLTTPLGILMGASQANPYAGPFPAFAQGIGGIGYYDIKPLATNAMYLPSGSISLFNPFTYGSLNTGGTLTISTDVNRPGCVQGFTAPNQVTAYDEFGSYALCAQADSVPVLASVTGTFTATTFTPTAPITLKAPAKLDVGMWIRTSDTPAAYNGQITSWATNASGQVMSITVSGWFMRGGSGTGGTPSGPTAYINPKDKVWNFLNTVFLNGIKFTGTTMAGSTQVTGVSSTDGLVLREQLLQGVGIPVGATIAKISGSIIFLSQPATASGTVQITATAGTGWGKGAGEELDVFNAGVDFAAFYATDTASTTAGSYVLSGITVISQWRTGVVLYGAGIPVGSIVTGVDISNNTIRINKPATATAMGVSIKAVNQLDEGGTGIDMTTVGKLGNTGVLVRGGFGYGFLSHGAVDTAFLFRPDFDGGVPAYGFRSDGKLNGHASICDFAVTDHTTNRWCITGAGTVIENVSTPPASSTAPCITGQRAWDTDFEYRCVATNRWRKIAFTSDWP